MKTNKEFANDLRKLALMYETCENIGQVSTTIYCWGKDSVINTIKEIGGNFTKKIQGDYIHFESTLYPITLTANKDQFCKVIKTYDCQPLFNEHEEAELGIHIVNETDSYRNEEGIPY